MSATVVIPDSAISAPRSIVPTSAISRVTHGSIGPATCTNHSHKRVGLADPRHQRLGEVPVAADEAGHEDAGAVAHHGRCRVLRAQLGERPHRGDPAARHDDGTVAHLPGGPAGEHMPGADEPDRAAAGAVPAAWAVDLAHAGGSPDAPRRTPRSGPVIAAVPSVDVRPTPKMPNTTSAGAGTAATLDGHDTVANVPSHPIEE